MKKGLINIILLVLAVTNIILTAIVVFAIVPAMNNSNDLVKKVATAIDLEKEGNSQYTDKISIDDLVTHDFSDKLTVALNEDKKYASFGVTLSLNKKDESYEKHNEKLEKNENLMKSTISNIVSKYTESEFLKNQEAILQEITISLREMYNNTTFIYDTSFVDVVTASTKK